MKGHLLSVPSTRCRYINQPNSVRLKWQKLHTNCRMRSEHWVRNAQYGQYWMKCMGHFSYLNVHLYTWSRHTTDHVIVPSLTVIATSIQPTLLIITTICHIKWRHETPQILKEESLSFRWWCPIINIVMTLSYPSCGNWKF